jgi:hypothetical protein
LIQNRVFKDDKKAPVHWSLVQGGGGSGSLLALDDEAESCIEGCLD